MTNIQVYAGAVAVGALTGIRSLSGPALAGEIVPPESMPIGPLTLKALAVGEFIADKLPFMPDRTSLLPLAGRAMMGGLSGAAICSYRKESIALGAALGALAAVGMTFVAFRLRKKLSDRIPGPLVGVAEDLIVTGVGALIVSRFDRPAITA